MGKNASGLFVQVTEVLKVSQGAALALAMFFQAVRNQDSCQELVMPRPAVSDGTPLDAASMHARRRLTRFPTLLYFSLHSLHRLPRPHTIQHHIITVRA